MSEKNIYQRIKAVINEGLYVKRGSAGQGTGVLYDEVIAVLTPHLVKHGIVFNAEKSGEARSRETKKGNYIYECDFNIHYINVDSPEDRFTTFVEAHAGDAGDKAPGKAITYATKISLLKVFQIETGENDESREETKDRLNVITQDQAAQLAPYCINGGEWSPLGLKLLKAYKIQQLEQLPESKFKEALERCKGASNGNS